MAKLFSKRKEDFRCAHCGAIMAGSGYTNHCSVCLWSMHVDVNPGDRKESCGGMMEPIGVERSRTKIIIIHRCTKCGKQRRVSASSDDYDAIDKIFPQR